MVLFFLEQNRRSRIFGEITLPSIFHGLSFLPISGAKDSPFFGISTCSLKMSAEGRGYFLRLFCRTHFCLCRIRNILYPIATQARYSIWIKKKSRAVSAGYSSPVTPPGYLVLFSSVHDRSNTLARCSVLAFIATY